MRIKQGQTVAAKKVIAFTAVSSANLQTRLDASALAFTVRIIKADGTSVVGAGVGGIGNKGITQPDLANARGVCFYTPGAGDIDVLGQCVAVISAAGMETREITFEVTESDPDVATAVFGRVIDALADVGAQTFEQQWRIAAAYTGGDGDGLDGNVGSVKNLATVPGNQKNVLEFTMVAGKRRYTKRDGT